MTLEDTRFGFIEQDTRLVEQKKRRHHLNHQEHSKYLKSLPDDSANGEELVVAPVEEIEVVADPE